MAEESVPQAEVLVKRCPRCKKNVPAKNFSFHRGTSDGLNWCCKPCAVKYLRDKMKSRTPKELLRIKRLRRNPKRCSKCGETKPGNEYYRSMSAYDMRSCYCKSCTSLYSANIRNRNKAENRNRAIAIPGKTCTGCRQWKPKKNFHRMSSSGDGLNYRCSKCTGHYRSSPCKRKIFGRRCFLRRRMRVLRYYGGDPPKCALCGESHVEFLVIDHVNGGGHQHLLKRKVAELAFWITKNGFPDGFRILCFSCNTVTGFRKPTSFTRKAEILRKWKRNLKRRILVHYGGDPPRCACCGIEKADFLGIDHHGARRYKKHRSGTSLYHWIYKHGYPPGFRVLCFNCNSSIGFHGYCPHEISSKSRQ